MAYKVQLTYFRPPGKFLAIAETLTSREAITDVWTDVNDMRRLPGLRLGASRDLFVVIDVPDHPQRRLHMVMPPFLDEEDVTPARTMTGEAALLVRVPLNARVPRTTTRDIVRAGERLRAQIAMRASAGVVTTVCSVPSTRDTTSRSAARWHRGASPGSQ